MKKIKKATQELINNMEETMIQTIEFYRSMQTEEGYSEKYSDENLKQELKEMANAYNLLLANQYNVINHISRLLWHYETIIETRKYEKLG